MRFGLVLLAFGSLLIAGCQGEPQSADAKASAAPMDPAKGDNPRGDAKVIHDPAQAKPGEGYRIAPANPNDKIFQPDPKLAGGN